MYPDFLVIGAQKAGTSWLYRNLCMHPQIWVPPKKEIHYFDHLEERNTNWLLRAKNKRWWRQLRRRLLEDIRHFTLDNSLWDFKYFFRRTNDQWYQSLFKPATDQKAGDMTPAYSALNLDAVQHVFHLMPNARMIFILRNPIERAWSQALMDLTEFKGYAVNDIPEAEFIRHFESPESRLRGDYIRTLENWLSVFPKEQFFIGFLEDIKQRPEELLLQIYRFIGVSDAKKFVPEIARQKIHGGKGVNIPVEMKAHLTEIYRPSIEQLATRFSGIEADYVRAWLDTSQG